MKNYVPILIALYLLIFTLCGCAFIPPLSPTPNIDLVIKEKFALAQDNIAIYYPDTPADPHNIQAEEFMWVKVHNRFKCGDTEGAYGCFHIPNRIEYQTTDALWHESGHAILFALGDYRWRCSFGEHADKEECQ